MKLGFGISNVQGRQIIKNKNRALSFIVVCGIRCYSTSVALQVGSLHRENEKPDM